MRRESETDSGIVLPACVDEYVTAVVKKMRCRKRVRADVRAEIRAHFEDALKDDATAAERQRHAEDLIAAFGDVKLLAVLCRRAKKRCRPLWIRVLARSLKVAGLFVLVFTVYAIWFMRGRPGPTTDYLSQLNRLTCPQGSAPVNAWSYYERALALVVEPNAALVAMPAFEKWQMRPYEDLKSLTRGEKRAIQGWLGQNDMAWRLFEAGSQQEHCHRVYRKLPGKPLIMNCMDHPPLQNLKLLTQLCTWKVGFAMAEGRVDEGLEHCFTTIRAAAHWQRTAFLIEQLVGWAMGRQTRREVRRILDASDLSASDLHDLQTQLLSLYATGYPEVNVECERLVSLDGLQYDFTRWGPGGGHHIFGAYTNVLYAVLLTSNIVTFLTKFSGGGGVKLLQGYMLRASQGGDDFSSFGGYVVASAAG